MSPRGIEPQQRADLMAGRDLGEAGLAREVRQAAARAPGYFQACISTMAQALMPAARASAKASSGAGFIERFDLLPSTPTRPPISTTSLVQHASAADIEVEQTRPCLVADPQRIGEARG